MKILFLISLTLLQATILFGQKQYWVMPNKYNSFINKPDISWACEMYSIHSFSDPVNIHEYLIDCQKKGTIKSYVTKEYLDEKIKWIKRKIDDYYFEIDKGYIFEKLESYNDTANEVEYHQIFYIENHKLRSNIISAAPQLRVYTAAERIYIGNTATSYSCLNYDAEQKQNKKDSIIYMGNTYSVLNFNSIEERGSLKKTYGMTLSLTLWNDLSNGFNKVVDLKTNSLIASSDVIEYSPFDSIEQIICIDSIAPLIYKIKAAPGYEYFSDIGILQDWYYNKTKNIFFTDIKKAYLHINYIDQKTMQNVNEKRFEITFK